MVQCGSMWFNVVQSCSKLFKVVLSENTILNYIEREALNNIELLILRYLLLSRFVVCGILQVERGERCLAMRGLLLREGQRSSNR